MLIPLGIYRRVMVPIQLCHFVGLRWPNGGSNWDQIDIGINNSPPNREVGYKVTLPRDHPQVILVGGSYYK